MSIQKRICYYRTPQSYTPKDKIPKRIIFSISLPEGMDLCRLKKSTRAAKCTQMLGVLPY